jgi:outer membrane protein insertion porin family
VKRLWCIAVGLCAAAGLVLAQGDAPIVREIGVRNDGAGPVEESFVLSHVRTAVGDPLSGVVLASDVKALLATGRFSYVATEADSVEGGVHITYVVRNKLKLAEPVIVSGARHLRSDKVRDMLGLDPGDPIDEQTVSVRARKVVDEYHADLYFLAKVSVTVEEVDHEEGTGRVRVEILEGKRAGIKSFVFNGNSSISYDELWHAVETRGWWNPARWFDRRQHDPEKLDKARQAIEDLYKDRGFLDVVVEYPDVRLDARGIEVIFTIREGVMYHLADVRIEGITSFPEAQVRTAMRTKKGDLASTSAVKADRQAIEDYYGSRGYIDARVRVSIDPTAGKGLITLTFVVSEGSLVNIRNIKIRGNSRTRDKVIRRELLVYPGEVFDRTRVRRSERRLQNLGYFSSVRSDTEQTAIPAQRDLVFDVDEKRTGQFMMGAGFSSVDQLMGFVELSQGNFDLFGWPYFTGAGQKLKLRAQIGQTRTSYELSFVEPWFMDEKLSLGLDLFRQEQNYTDYDVARIGGAVSLSSPLPGPNRVQLRYELVSSEITDVSDTNEYYYVDEPTRNYSFMNEANLTKSTIGITLRHDSRDNSFVATRGNRASIFCEVSGGVLGGDTDMVNVGFRTAHYLPVWFKHVLSLKTRYQVVEPYGDTEDVPIDDRLFLGGGQTLRGFEYRDVGPKVIPAGLTEADGKFRPVGGRSLAMASIEYTVPVVEGIRLAVFYDTGNVWSEAYEFHPDDLASSAGLGIRLDMPGFPIRIDRAWVVKPDDDLTGEDPWVIWIGYDF